MNGMKILERLVTVAIIIVTAVIAYEIFAAARQFLREGTGSMSVYTLITLVVSLALGAKLLSMLKS